MRRLRKRWWILQNKTTISIEPTRSWFQSCFIPATHNVIGTLIIVWTRGRVNQRRSLPSENRVCRGAFGAGQGKYRSAAEFWNFDRLSASYNGLGQLRSRYHSSRNYKCQILSVSTTSRATHVGNYCRNSINTFIARVACVRFWSVAKYLYCQSVIESIIDGIVLSDVRQPPLLLTGHKRLILPSCRMIAQPISRTLAFSIWYLRGSRDEARSLWQSYNKRRRRHVTR